MAEKTNLTEAGKEKIRYYYKRTTMTAIAIGDEPVALEIVRSHAAKVPFLELKETFTNAFKAAEYL